MDNDQTYQKAARRLMCSRKKLETMFAILTTPQGDFLVERAFLDTARIEKPAAPAPRSIITPDEFMQMGAPL